MTYTRTALPRCLQLRVGHGNDPSDADLERISVYRGTHSREIVARIWLPVDEVDDDFWHEDRRHKPSGPCPVCGRSIGWNGHPYRLCNPLPVFDENPVYRDPLTGVPTDADYFEHLVRENTRAQFFNDDGDVLAEERF